MIAVNPVEKIAFWPKFKTAKLVDVLMAAVSYFLRDSWYRLTSYSSLLKYFTVS